MNHSCPYNITSKFEYTNIKCNCTDPSFCIMEHCYIKSINRTYKYISIKAKLLQAPVTKLNFALYKRLNGYLPFLYNITVDSCRFLKNTKSNLIADFFYSLLRPYSNLNHTCPYDHDLIIDKLPTSFLNNQLTHILPLPEGQYMLRTNWIAYDILRGKIDFYGNLS
ncbi:uncharacterized protein LOC108104212 [Drosophila eugracilis]|uniref:uncharacterized protein LOC108104212 n=1 Tax=Drosophila eugracilis TaxID=29029 RepID=UPI0007E69A12|nr:uncharacterized protein LOC108104212 [Drosophila eugracilis]